MGDYVRWAPPHYEGADDSAKSSLFLALNRNKRSIRINLKEERGREVLLRLVKEYDVVIESFRPGVMDRLGVGYERLREENPRVIYCAITGYGQDGPYRDRSGHDMNYLGLIGLLGLTGERDGPPIQSAGQIADLGGGALMAAFGVLAALHERERSGEGQLVDVSMADGALAWMAMVAGRYFADGQVPKRGELDLAGRFVCYRPYACKDGWVTLGALEPKFFQAWCRGVGRDELIEKQFEPPGSEAHAEIERIFLERTREEWREFASQHDCCLEPVLDLDEALDSELVRAREMVVELDQPGTDGVKQLGVPVKMSRTPGGLHAPGPALGEHTREVLAAAGYSDDRDLRARGRGRRRRPGRGRRGVVHGMSATERNGMLKMAELAEASGVSAGTIKHYLREGLLPEPVKTSRNMAWYPPEFVERIQLIKELQERRFMPLKAIKGILDLEGEATRVSGAELKRRYGVPQEVLDRLAELEVITPNSRGYGVSDVRIVEAISRFRAGGYDEKIGFTVYDTLRYKRAMDELAKEEVEVMVERLGEADAERAAGLVETGAEPLRDLISALHTKALVAELKQQRAARE